jgi:hypothetical protein
MKYSRNAMWLTLRLLARVSTPSILVCGPEMITVPTASAVIEKLRRNGERIEILQLAANFHTAEAGEAARELLSRLQQAIAARSSG